MTFPAIFADWYRSAALTPSEGLMEKRWAGVEDLAKKPSAAFIISSAKLFSLPNATASDAPAGFQDSFHAHDDLFPTKENRLELRVLAGAVLRRVMEQHEELGTLAALAIVCGAFGNRGAVSLEPDHIDAAQRLLVERAVSTRKSLTPFVFQIPDFPKDKLLLKLPQAPFAANQLPAIHEPLITVLSEITGGFSSALVKVREAIEQLAHTAKVREEEMAILWWLQSRFSRDLEKPFSEVGYVSGALVLPMELADLTIFVPGSETTLAVLVRSLSLAGAPSSSEAVTISNATNATPREWREKISSIHQIGSSGPLTPVLLAIHKSLETEGRDEWLPVYRKSCDIPADEPFPLIQLSQQLFYERMLLKALGEVQS